MEWVYTQFRRFGIELVWFPILTCSFASSSVFTLGLSLSLTEAELFDSASRTARLVAAYYSFAHESLYDGRLW